MDPTQPAHPLCGACGTTCGSRGRCAAAARAAASTSPPTAATTWQRIMNGLPDRRRQDRRGRLRQPRSRLRRRRSRPEGRPLPIRRCREDLAAGQRRAGRCTTRSWYYMKVVADPKNPDVVWVLNAPVSRSIDGGRRSRTVRMPHGDNHSLWINPDDPQILIEGNDGGANVSFNGGPHVVHAGQPADGAVLSRERRQRVPLQPLRRPAGQHARSKIASAAPGGITERDWYDVGGCESAVPAFDPDNPRFVYAGCYMGIISEFDLETKTARDVMAWPQMPAAMPPRELEVPLQLERADRRLARSTATVDLPRRQRAAAIRQPGQDVARGQPRPHPQRQEQAGAGRRADHQRRRRRRDLRHDHLHRRVAARRGTLWVGTDDGCVQLTRDAGRTWSNVTPPDVGEALVNAIEVSPHDPATAYVDDHASTSSTTSRRTSSRPPTSARPGRASSRASPPRPGRASCARTRCARTCCTSAPKPASTSRSTAAGVDALPAESAGHADDRPQGAPRRPGGLDGRARVLDPRRPVAAAAVDRRQPRGRTCVCSSRARPCALQAVRRRVRRSEPACRQEPARRGASSTSGWRRSPRAKSGSRSLDASGKVVRTLLAQAAGGRRAAVDAAADDAP